MATRIWNKNDKFADINGDFINVDKNGEEIEAERLIPWYNDLEFVKRQLKEAKEKKATEKKPLALIYLNGTISSLEKILQDNEGIK